MRRNVIVYFMCFISVLLVVSCAGPVTSPPVTRAPSTNPTSASPTSANPASANPTSTVSGTSTTGGSTQAVSVTIQDSQFSPKVLTVKKGTTVTWTNQGQMKHTVTADDGKSFDHQLDPGQSFSFTFDQAGTFAYYCRFHGGPGGAGMSGSVVVQ